MELLALFLKKEEQLELNNYRGRIILFNTGYKIFSNALYENLQSYAENIVDQYQCGFKKVNQQSTKFIP
jgi:hypothetical protein